MGDEKMLWYWDTNHCNNINTGKFSLFIYIVCQSQIWARITRSYRRDWWNITKMMLITIVSFNYYKIRDIISSSRLRNHSSTAEPLHLLFKKTCFGLKLRLLDGKVYVWCLGGGGGGVATSLGVQLTVLQVLGNEAGVVFSWKNEHPVILVVGQSEINYYDRCFITQ